MPATKVAKSADFMEWYNEVVELAELTDKRYPIKGMNIWRPYGQRIMNRIDSFTRSEMERTGHDEVSFPLLIPEKLFLKEAEQIKGFGGEVFWVTHAGNNPLPDKERWVVRPTSECAMYDIFPLWIRSHSDLPLQTFQICNVFRYETKQTRAFMRVREIHFFEDHSVFPDEASARAHVDLDLEIVRNVYDKLALPALYTKRPDWDKFPGAVDSIGADVVMPSGRMLQSATVHYYGTNFSKAYDMTYQHDGHAYAQAVQNALPAGFTVDVGLEHRLELGGKISLEDALAAQFEEDISGEDATSQLADERGAAKLTSLTATGPDGTRWRFLDGTPFALKREGERIAWLPKGTLAGRETPSGTVPIDVEGTRVNFPQFYTHDYCHQTTYGMSERLVGAIVGCHGDDNGLILPPEIAPVQVVIVPIVFKGDEDAIHAYAQQVADRLRAAGVRVHVDLRDRKPGDKYYHWELRGVPLRLEIGPRDVQNKAVFAARRDRPGKEGKQSIPLAELESTVEQLLGAIQEGLYVRQEEFAKDRIRRVQTLGEAKAIDAADERSVVFEMPISGDDAAKRVEEELDIKTLGVPVDSDADASKEKCAVTGEAATVWIRFARTY